MKKSMMVSLATFLLSVAYADTSIQAVKKEGLTYIKMLGGALKKELQAHLKQDPSGLEALAFCSGSAEQITKKVNSRLPQGAKVYRTALKVRNPHNSPDATDTEVMRSYEKSLSEGKSVEKEIRVVKLPNGYRVYKPLLTKGVCLKCHGEHLSPEIREGLRRAYPNDKATGFKLGDLRGVIVSELTKKTALKNEAF